MRFTEPLFAVPVTDLQGIPTGAWEIRGRAPMSGGYGPVRAIIAGTGAKAQAIAERFERVALLENAAECVVHTLERCAETDMVPDLEHLARHCRDALEGKPTPRAI